MITHIAYFMIYDQVDRCVTGLVAQQQCVGPLHTPLADVAVLAQTHFSLTGVAVAVGEQPIKGLISPAAQVIIPLHIYKHIDIIKWLIKETDIKCYRSFVHEPIPCLTFILFRLV